MLYCEHCETDECLELVGGEIDVGDDDELTFVELEYRCSIHGLEGTYRAASDVHDVSGALVRVETCGTPIDEQYATAGGDRR